jgi:diaminopimelate epimerase
MVEKQTDMRFTKLQATGNDFVLIDLASSPEWQEDWSSLARAMCNRRLGVGSDGLILLSESDAADFRMRMFNPDGSEAEVCGNGLRCFARYVTSTELSDKDSELTIETAGGIKRVELHNGGSRFRVDMGKAKFGAEEIPLSAKVDKAPIIDYRVNAGGRELLLTFVSMGNPHGVCFVDYPDSFPLSELGPIVEHHELFPRRLNFEVANVVSRKEVKARVWERGAGETLSCGTGACAVAVAAHLHGYVDNAVDVVLPGGRLGIQWDGQGDVYLTGPAEVVFTGCWPKQNLLEER